ncbi:major facilitator superfamily domain-containing protein [Triangularia setosa]|uniref:Major facilitator superfamily domain-containing protein n=1 Tax=Triangularia setosa TaxID=2587417 RepID=A0AAN6VZD8_9PEZI|nr:major facilitator superfamily domain-containing protein [Podospora setosa]
MAQRSVLPEECHYSLDVNTANGYNAGQNKEEDDAQNNSAESRAQSAEFSLPPVDRGKDAWLFLAACYAIEAVTFGFGFSFGVLQDYYSSHEPFAGSGSIAAIGTTSTGIMYMGTPFVLTICRLYPRWARWSTLAGLFLASLSLLVCSFCNSADQLIGVQGVLFGIGGCVAYCPSTLYIDEWFSQRKGLAYGIVWSAAGVGGVIFPLILQALLDNLGFQTAMRVSAGILFACSAPLALFVKPRLPYLDNPHNVKKPFNMRFVASRRFLLHQTANVIEATGYFLPGIYLPTYAREIFGTSTFMSALTLMLVNISATVGLVIMGSMSDRFQVTTCMVISAVGASASVLVVWGLAESLPVLYVFCVLYGISAGSWASTWPGIMREVSQNGEIEGYGLVDPVMVQGHLCVGRGVGNVISGPLSSALISSGMLWQGRAMGSYGTRYGTLVLYTGLTALLSGMNILWKCLSLL